MAFSSDFDPKPPADRMVPFFACLLEFNALGQILWSQFGPANQPHRLAHFLAHSNEVTMIGLVAIMIASSATLRDHARKLFAGLPFGSVLANIRGRFGGGSDTATPVSNMDKDPSLSTTGGLLKGDNWMMLETTFYLGHFQASACWQAVRLAAAILQKDGKGPRVLVSPVGIETRHLRLIVLTRSEDLATCETTLRSILASHARSIDFTVAPAIF